jgi:hypothetical protein
MTKIVYNDYYGGFYLSEKAIQRYSDLAGLGLTLVKDKHDNYLWELPNGEYWNYKELSRTDPFLVQVVEEQGEEAGGFTRLMIREIPEGTRYRIEEYDGEETMMTIDEYEWSVA